MKPNIPLTPYPVDIELKSHPEPFRKAWSGEKTHEIRINDRKYRYAMAIRLKEFNPHREEYSGRAIDLIITHLRYAEGEGVPFSNGLKPGFIVFDFVILNQYTVIGKSVDTSEPTPFFN